MSILKCKMCGGDLNVVDGSTLVECEYCGTRQTVPCLDNEKKLSLFNRANRLRFACEFDKAAGVYESIVTDFPEEAEAYWGLVLCKYGIEYVDDPKTGKKVPTCHRSSFESVFDCDSFDMVMENADVIAKPVYREEAKTIEELRKGIIEVSSKEAPYDIFICYKETAPNGDRTVDSVIAQEVYDALTEKGYRVFFSRITLEEKLGQEYEPYIFAALNSAKIMLAFGTDYEYYNAVWVKNEWSRFLELIEQGEKKTLIPCFKGIDAYDMPKEFARLQAQDMGKVGAIQDLLRGIEKILPRKSEIIQTSADNTLVAGIQTLLKRVQLFIEDGEWNSALSYCEKVLDLDPQNPYAYLYKLMARHKLATMEQLSACIGNLIDDPDLIKARRFSDEALNSFFDSSIDKFKRDDDELRKKLFDARAKHKLAKEMLVSFKNRFVYFIDKRMRMQILSVEDGTHSEGEERFVAKAYTAYEMPMAFLHKDGSLSFESIKGYNGWKLKEPLIIEASQWTDLKDIYYGKDHLIGLKNDGTVVSCGSNWIHRCEVEGMHDVDSIKCGDGYTYAITKSGSVISTKENLPPLTDIVDLYGDRVFLKKNGEVINLISGKEHTTDHWKDIVTLVSNNIAITADGKVVFASDYNAPEILKDAKEVVSIEEWSDEIYVLTLDGKVHHNVDRFKALPSKCFENALLVGKTSGVLVILHTDGTVTVIDNKGNMVLNTLRLFDSIDTLDEERAAEMELEPQRVAEEQRIKEERERIEAEQKAVEDEKDALYEEERAMLRDELRNKYSKFRFMISGGFKNTVIVTSKGRVVGDKEFSYIRRAAAVTCFFDSFKIKHTLRVLTRDGQVKGEWGSGIETDGLKQIAACKEHIHYLHDDGKINYDDRGDFVELAQGDGFYAALRKDGTVAIFGEITVNEKSPYANGGQRKNFSGIVSKWTDIVSIAAGHNHLVGIKRNGTVVACGDTLQSSRLKKKADFGGEKNALYAACGADHTVVLHPDGTVSAYGDNRYNQCNVSEWRNIIAVACGYNHTIGLQKDGKVIAVGDNVSVSGYKVFDSLDNFDAEVAASETEFRRENNRCLACGGEFKGLFTKKCAQCGKPKNY